MKQKLLALAVPAAIALSACSGSQPSSSEAKEIMSPTESRKLPGTISALSQEEFWLFLDSDLQNKVVYYIPKHGRLAVQGTNTKDPIARLQAFVRTISSGFLAGESIVNFGGMFSTVSSTGAVARLEKEADAGGYQIQAAPVSGTETEVLLGTRHMKGDGRLDVKCTVEKSDAVRNGVPIPINVCKAKNSDGDYDIDTEVVYNGGASSYHGSVIGGSIPFSVQLVPSMTPVIESTLSSGGNFDAVIQTRVKWNLAGQRLTHRAELEVNWENFYEAAAKFQAYHNGACQDIEVREFFHKQVTCQNDGCPVKVKWFDGEGKQRDQAPTDKEFLAAVDAVRKDLEKEVFQRVAYINPDTDKVDDSISAQYVSRTNHRRILHVGKLVRNVYYNPGATIETAETSVGISCAKGDLNGKIGWDMESESCRQLVGQ